MAKNEKNCSIQITIFWSITFANNTHGLLSNKLIVTALPRTSYPAICGTSSGHHMYIHLGRTSTTTASLKVGPTCAYVDISNLYSTVLNGCNYSSSIFALLFLESLYNVGLISAMDSQTSVDDKDDTKIITSIYLN